MNTRLAVSLCFLALVITGCSVHNAPAIPEGVPSAESEYEYRIGPEDVLKISVWKNPELSNTVAVRPDGKISLPLLNDVQAAGFTPTELRSHLKSRLKVYMNNVELSIIVEEIHSRKISVLGQVTNPARYELKSRLTVLDAIAMAGGLTQFAAPKRIVVIRKNGKGRLEKLPFNFIKTSRSHGTVGNFHVRPHDIVMVPKSIF